MPDDISRASGQNWAAQHASQHTSSHVTPLNSEPSSNAFPVPQQSAASEPMSPFPAAVPMAAPDALRVVVADDNPVVRAYRRSALRP